MVLGMFSLFTKKNFFSFLLMDPKENDRNCLQQTVFPSPSGHCSTDLGSELVTFSVGKKKSQVRKCLLYPTPYNL